VEYIWPVKGVLAGGVSVSMHGSGFLIGEGVLCRFGSEVAKAQVLSSTVAACMTPARESPGVVAVEVSVNGGADFSDVRRDFTYAVAATVEGLVPSRGEGGVDGQVVTVVGQHFEASGQLRCRFGQDHTVQGLYLSSTLVACKAPLRGAGTVTVGVSDGGLRASGSVGFEYGARRVALSCSPTKGPAEGGTRVAVTGWDIEAGVDGVECQFGMDRSRLGTAIAGGVVCSTPSSGAAGVVNLLVRKRSEGEGAGTLFKFEYYANPMILDVFPGSGLVQGGTVVCVWGANFGTDGLTCRFGAFDVTGADARLVTSSVVACVAPQPLVAGAVAVEISLNGGVDYTASGKQYVYETNPTVDSLRPSWVIAGVANQVVTVVGRHFKKTQELSCRMGVNATVSAVYVSSSSVVCRVPVRGAGTVRVSVSNNGVDAGLSSKQLAFEAGRGISSVTPSRAPAQGGTSVTVSMYGRMQGEVGTVSCHFGTDKVEGEVRGHSTVICITPTASQGAVEFRVSEGPSGAFLPGILSFEHLERLRMVSVQPSVGTLGRRTAVSVVVSGGVSGATGLQCRFGMETVTGDGVRAMTSSMITCLAPVSRQRTQAAPPGSPGS
jgi:hypothetical protein